MKQGSGKRTRAALGALAAALALAIAGSSAFAGAGDTTLISRKSKSAGGEGGDGISREAAISANGRFVAFQTESTNLGGPIDESEVFPSNIYVYDRERKRVELVSRQSKSNGGEGADASSFHPTISANGRFVTFYTSAGNLVGAAENTGNIFVYDRKLDKVELVSRRSKSKGGEGANENSEDGVIAGNGRFVLFQTIATNLGGPIVEDLPNHYVYDRKLDKVELISRQSKAAGGAGQDEANYDDYPGSISHSGRFASWQTPATNLGGPIVPGNFDRIYVYDRKRNRVELVSRKSKSAGGQGAATAANAGELSATGRFVAFSTGSDLGGPVTASGNVYVYDRKLDKVELVSRKSNGGPGASTGSGNPDISGDGNRVTFELFDSDLGGPTTDNVYDVYVYDRAKDKVRLVSRAGNGGPGGDDFSTGGTISADGRFVAFETNAGNLGGPVGGAPVNVYVHELP